MKIKEILFNLGELFNFHLVYAAYGYLGDMHRAVNFAYSSPYLMLSIRDMLFFQAQRRGITPKELAFSNIKQDSFSPLKAEAIGIRKTRFI